MPGFIDAHYLRRLLDHRQATQQAVVRRDELLRADPRVNDSPLTPDAWVDHGNVNRIGRVPTRCLGKSDRASPNVARWHRMRQVDDLRARVDRKNHPFHRADVSAAQTEVSS